MAGGESKLQTLGFLTVVEQPLGLFGGYLLLNLLGRPVEFHCTTPVKPSRAQEILYGPTLAPYLCGELIGQTLVSKASHKPLAVFTDAAPVRALRELVGMPVVEVWRADEETTQLRIDGPHPAPRPALATFRWGANSLAVDPLHGGDRELVLERLRGVMDTFDLSEPFARIREAIDEAQRGTR